MDRTVVLKLISMDLRVSFSLMSELSGHGARRFSGAEASFVDSIYKSHLTAHPGFRRWELLEVLCSNPVVRSSKPLQASHITNRPPADSPMPCGADPQEAVTVRGVSATRGLGFGILIQIIQGFIKWMQITAMQGHRCELEGDHSVHRMGAVSSNLSPVSQGHGLTPINYGLLRITIW